MLLTKAAYSSVIDVFPVNPKDILAQAISYRKSITSGQAVLIVTWPCDISNPENQKTKYKFDVSFDKNSIRSDLMRINPNWSTRAASIISKNKFISDWNKNEYIKMGTIGLDSSRLMIQNAFRPTLLGLSTCNISQLHERNFNNVFFFSNYKFLAISQEFIEQENTWHIKYSSGDDHHVDAWFVPRFGHGLVRMVVENQTPDDRNYNRILLETTYKSFPSKSKNIWFPKNIKLSQFNSKNNLFYQENVSVEEAEFGKTFNQEFFSLQGMNLSQGRRVLDGHSLNVWDGRVLRRARRSEMNDFGAWKEGRKPYKLNWILYINCAFFALLGLRFGHKFIKNYKK